MPDIARGLSLYPDRLRMGDAFWPCKPLLNKDFPVCFKKKPQICAFKYHKDE